MTRYLDGKALTPGEPGYDQAGATPDAKPQQTAGAPVLASSKPAQPQP